MTKIKAFFSHLGISTVIFLAVLFLIIFEWYPPPFFSTDGGWQGIRIMVGVDLVLGPLLTLSVFKPGKPGLKFDLTVIGIIQACALSWGIWTIHHERPFGAVYAENYFSTVTGYEVSSYDKTKEKLKKLGDKAPYWIFSNLPRNPDALQKIRLDAIHSGRPMFQLSEYYGPINSVALREIKAQAIDMQKWLKGKAAAKQRYQAFMRNHGQQAHLIFLPWHARKKYKIVVLNADTGKYAGTLDITPPNVSSNYPTMGDSGKVSASS